MDGRELQPEPDGSCLVVDKDGDVWRYVAGENAWVCLSEAGSGSWSGIQWCAPFQVFIPQTDDGAADAAHAMGGSLPPAVPSSPGGSGSDRIGGQPGSAAPRTFQLMRHVDKSGVSGTGVVAEGVQFSDGSVAVRWRGDNPSTAAWNDLAGVIAVHGHQGATELQWLDDGGR